MNVVENIEWAPILWSLFSLTGSILMVSMNLGTLCLSLNSHLLLKKVFIAQTEIIIPQIYWLNKSIVLNSYQISHLTGDFTGSLDLYTTIYYSVLCGKGLL